MPRPIAALRRLLNTMRHRPAVYPPIEPYREGRLPVTGGHELYFEECGNPGGTPVLFLHGGPGAGCNAYNRRFFDPAHYRIVLFDQRGAGRSRPYAALEHNTTDDLVSDIEALRRHLAIDRWLLFGGSWGATLALVYAQAHPRCVLGLILRGVFLCRQREIDWFYRDGASRLLPEAWQTFRDAVPAGERGDLLDAYLRLLTGDDERERLRAALAWSTWEGQASALKPSQSQLAYFEKPAVAECMATIECHYFRHRGFLEEDQILRDASRLAGIPGIIIHGRYDLICPVEGACELHAAWPGSELEIIPAAGHSAAEPAVARALVDATRRFLEAQPAPRSGASA